ncbi:MAG TPA: ATP-binding cassette domain-containing protein [Candidatus Kapabacteria bacterium]|nr:ATP-binding cassette domain-containing protein [Candidatus Kapabacteria bacterium]
MSEIIVSARNLQKRYGEFEAVKGIDFEVRRQECFGILGPNGAGKSSTIRMLHCISPLSGGELTILGEPADGDIRKIKSNIGVVPQDNNLDQDLSVEQNLHVYSRYFGIPKAEARKRTDEVLELVQLLDKRRNRVDELSGGMQRRLVIARSLLNRPKLLVLDEPTTGLDPAARQLVWQKLRLLRDQGLTLILTTHYMEEAAQLCDRLVMMNEGKILAGGTPAKLVEEMVGFEVIELRAEEAASLNILTMIEGKPIEHEIAGDTLYLFSKTHDAFDALTLPHLNFRLQRRATLEDVFLKLTGRDLTE